MAAGRKKLILELQAAETRLEVQWERVHEISEARLDYLRRAHPGWLIGGGFVSGVVVERMLAVWAGSAMASMLVCLKLAVGQTNVLRYWVQLIETRA